MSKFWRYWRDWPLAAKGAAVIALPVLLLLLGLGTTQRSQQALLRADDDVQRMLEIQSDIQTLHTLVAEAASGVRGFLLAGSEEFLTPYWNATDRLPQTLEALRSSIRDPLQKQYLAETEVLIATKLSSLNTLRQQGSQFEPAALQEHLRSGKAVLDALRQKIEQLRVRESELLAERTAIAKEARQRLQLLGIVAAVVALAGTVFALWILSAGIIGRVQLVAANAERLVGDRPLLPYPAARDELGLLAERLQRASLLLAERAREAQAASRAKTDFLSRTSHELRTPLNAILGFAQLLTDDIQQEPAASHVAQVLAAGRHLLALIDEVLDIARIESGAITLEQQAVSLPALLDEVQALIAPAAAEQALHMELPDATGVAVQGDARRLKQVLLNIVSNAVKFNRRGGRVTLTLRREANTVALAVSDTGPGIAADLLPRLFAPFERLNAERQGVQGTGLGLAISRQLIERMGGEITVVSTPGQGSTFTLKLNTAASTPATANTTAADASQRSATHGSAPLSVLCVEDNRSNIALIQAVLGRRPGWQLSVATTAEQGLQRARAEQPQLILLDLHLPDGNGETLLSTLKADATLARTPVVVLSADALPATIERVKAAGAADYLTKPLDVSRLLTRLDALASAIHPGHPP